MAQCQGTNRRGGPCGNRARRGEMLCYAHAEKVAAPEPELDEPVGETPRRKHERRALPYRQEVPRARHEDARARGRSVGHVEVVKDEVMPQWMADAMDGVNRRARVGAVPAVIVRHPKHKSWEGAVLVLPITDAATVLEVDDPDPVDRS